MQIPDVPPQLLAALVEAAAGQRLALVGGVVRDLLLHRHHQDPWRGLPDLDLVVEGRAADLVERLPAALANQIGRPVPIREQHHGRYGTAELELALPPECGGTWLIDLASARQEVYPRPGANPVVSLGSLEHDLARRDVSVNAMASVLNPHGAGVVAAPELLDPFGGQADLARRQLRFLHPHSLRDDPTRLLRAARYAARLGFDLAPEALEQARATLRAWPWDWRLGDDPAQAPPALATRLRMELELLLEREPWPAALALLQRWGGCALFDPGLQRDRTWGRRLRWGARLGAPPLPVLLAAASDPMALVRRLQLPHGQQALMARARQLEQHLPQIPWPSPPSQWCGQLEALPGGADAVALLIALGVQPRRPLLRWFWCWRHVASPLGGAALRQRGWPPGPALGAELKRLRAEELDRQCQP
ncbi:CCA tRNA nucleotidyltransferase [Vulcanococcus sp.]|jgi:poly(A) polymerase|uniref:CCA tRNA nucleotidyltransferase n=1 Tax=Vulcanococcus sp. TaxID=2856995 RepID=UPI0037D9C565